MRERNVDEMQIIDFQHKFPQIEHELFRNFVFGNFWKIDGNSCPRKKTGIFFSKMFAELKKVVLLHRNSQAGNLEQRDKVPDLQAKRK